MILLFQDSMTTAKKSVTVEKPKAKSSFDCSKTVLYQRTKETFKAAVDIHSAASDSKDQREKAARYGLWKTIETKTNTKDLCHMINSSKKVKPTMGPKKSEKELHELRLRRSLVTMYEGSQLSESKYQSLRNGEKYITKVMPDHVSLLPNKVLINEINRKHVTQLRVFELCDINGCWRTLENLLLCLAEHYFKIRIDIDWFGEEGKFVVLHGCDGAPFGRNETGTSFLISFLNVKHRVLSCRHNFLLMGGNCEEDSPDFLKYITLISKEMEMIESKEYVVCSRKITFKFEYTINDQKMYAKLCGQLTNSATYMSSFGNVNRNNMSVQGGKLGDSTDKRATWQEWDTKKCLQDATAISTFKKKNPRASRSKVTQFIAKRKSRTEFKPPLGRFATGLAEPLHLFTLAWQHWHNK